MKFWNYLLVDRESMTGKQKLSDLWLRKDAGIMKERYTVRVPSHGAVRLRAYKQTNSDE
jgi:hypothetical protein